MNTGTNAIAGTKNITESTIFSILFSLSFAHFLNDSMQSLIPSIYPLFKKHYHLDFAQIGLITLTYQLTASLLQPIVGSYTDRRPQPYSLAIGMCFTLAGLISLSFAGNLTSILLSVGLVGVGSSVFHPESSRMARIASGGRHGMAQSLFQVGGNTGAAVGPLMAAAIVVPFGQSHIVWFSLLALIGIFTLWKVGNWYRQKEISVKKKIIVPIKFTSRQRTKESFTLILSAL